MAMLEWCEGCGEQLLPSDEECDLCLSYVLEVLKLIEDL